MSEYRKPAYWTVLPARVRYDKELRPNAKLLFAEINALADATGYCWATNEHLGNLLDIAPRTVSDLISTLAKRGHIIVDIIRDPTTNEIVQRRIWIDKPVIVDSPPAEDPETPIAKNGDTPIADFCYTPIAENGDTPIAKNGYKNNINNINNIPPIVPQGGRQRREPKKQPDWKPERFNKFWKFYPRGEAKQAAIRAWDKLQPSDELIETMAKALVKQMATDEWKRGIGIPYASTWLNQRRWEDDIGKASAKQEHCSGSSGSWAEDEEVI